jgi:hypothetical protein
LIRKHARIEGNPTFPRGIPARPLSCAGR